MPDCLAVPPLPTLEGARVRLRWFRDDDVDGLFAMSRDPKVMRYTSSAPWTERRQAEEKLARIFKELREQDLYVWAIADSGDDRFLGSLAMFNLDREQHRTEVGYSLDASAQGRGLASEALRLALSFAFDVLGLLRIEADVDPRNTPSLRLVERLGFVREGLLRARWHVNGEVCDAAFYGLLRDEFVRADR